MNTMLFSAAQITRAILDAHPTAVVERRPMTGFYCITDNLIARLAPDAEEGILIEGVLTSGDCISENDETQIDTLVVRTEAGDELGGIQTDDENVALFGFRIEKLMKSLGFHVVRTRDGLF